MIYVAAYFDTAEDLDPEVAAALAEYERIQTGVEPEQHLTDAERALVADAELALGLELELAALGLELDATTAD